MEQGFGGFGQIQKSTKRHEKERSFSKKARKGSKRSDHFELRPDHRKAPHPLPYKALAVLASVAGSEKERKGAIVFTSGERSSAIVLFLAVWAKTAERLTG